MRRREAWEAWEAWAEIYPDNLQRFSRMPYDMTKWDSLSINERLVR